MTPEQLEDFIDWMRGEGFVIAERVHDGSGRLPSEYLHEALVTDQELIEGFLASEGN